jgi:hypothetical protein
MLMAPELAEPYTFTIPFTHTLLNKPELVSREQRSETTARSVNSFISRVLKISVS